MPLHDFRCPVCGPFEERLPITADATRVTCAACGAEAARVYRSPAIAGRRSAAALADAVDDRSRNAPQRVVGAPGSGPHGHHHGPTRPWQIAH